ncbi:MAG: hypothetical protein IKE20_05455, partial [Eggerthellaceae bacterium]|nr:hypothetical protein [Eggerthellaceae bacterium]
FTDWYNAEIKCLDTGRVYPCDFSGETDDSYSDEQNTEWALEDAREWCEWHSNQSIEHEHTEDGRIYRQ